MGRVPVVPAGDGAAVAVPMSYDPDRRCPDHGIQVSYLRLGDAYSVRHSSWWSPVIRLALACSAARFYIVAGSPATSRLDRA